MAKVAKATKKRKIGLRNIKFTYVDQEPLVDTSVAGNCTMARMRIGDYLRWVKLKDNAYQRNVVNVNRNRVYQKLVSDLLHGAVLPPISLVLPDFQGSLTKKLDMWDVRAFILDGLQRTNCLRIVKEFLEGDSSWKFLQDVNDEECLSLDEFLDKEVRLEIWTDMTMRSILSKMVSLNTGRVQMSVEHQLEILQLPLKKQLEDSTHQKVWLETELNDATQRSRRESGEFPLSLVVTGMIGYAKQDCHFSKTAEVVEMLGTLDEEERLREATLVTSSYGEKDLTFVVGRLAPKFFEVYSEIGNKEGRLPENAHLLMSDNETFFVPMMAALGWLRANALGEKQHGELTQRLEKLVPILDQARNQDPLGLSYFQKYASEYKSRIGYRRRRLVFEFFRELLGKEESRIDLVWKLAHNAAKA